MSTTVFISYAANDPAWPASDVRQLAVDLEALGATVHFDEFFEERRQEPGKPSRSEWREWMAAVFESADHIVCLCSQRYRQAAERDLEDPSGFGVAYESQKIMARLYRNKGRNNGWILTLRPTGARVEEVVPDDLQDDCPDYEWPRERVGALGHACRQRLDVEAIASSVNHSADMSTAMLLSRQAQRTADLLSEAEPFFQALKARRARKVPAPPWANADIGGFVAGLEVASEAEAQQLMWDVRAVLKPRGSSKPDAATMDAAVAVYMLCACRWMTKRLPVADGRALLVPCVPQSALAVFSAAMFGGQLMFDSSVAQPVPRHVYDVRVAKGESGSINLLRAIHSALNRDRLDAVEEARLDRDDDAAVRRLLADIRASVDNAREVDESAFTLLIDAPRAFDDATWRADLGVVPFSFDDTLAHDLLGVNCERLDSELRQLWTLLRPATESRPSPSHPAAESPMTTPPASRSRPPT